jgi:hypothetical protein
MTNLIAPSLTMMSDRQIQSLVWRSRLTSIPSSDSQLFFVGGAIAVLLPP